MGGAALPDWETEKQRRQQYARDRGHEGKLDNNFVNNEKPHTPLSHEREGVPWKPPAPLPQKGLQYVNNFLTAVAKSRREGRLANFENHASDGHIMPKRSGRRNGSWSDLRKPQLYGFLLHLGREWVQTHANLPEGDDGGRRFSEEERTYRLAVMQYLVSDMAAYYAALPNQPKLWECWAFHERLVLPSSQRGPSDRVREFTTVYPNPDRAVAEVGSGVRTKNKDLGA
jgi:hypothetical protein